MARLQGQQGVLPRHPIPSRSQADFGIGISVEQPVVGSDEIPVAPGIMQWETIPLSDGRVGRLTTTIAIHA